MVFTDSQAIISIGSEVYSANTSGVLTLIGTGVTGSGPVSMASNGFKIMMVNAF